MASKNNYYSDELAKKFGIKWNEKEQKDEDGNVIITSRPKPTLPSMLSAGSQEDIDYSAKRANEIAQKFGAKIPDNTTSRKTTVTIPTLNKSPEQIKRSKNLAEGATTYQDTDKQITIKPPMETMTGDDGRQYEVPTTAKKASNPVDFLLRNLATGTVRSVYDPLATGADIGDTSVKQAANKDGIQYRDDYLNVKNAQPNAIEQKYGTAQKVTEQPKTEPTLFEKEYKQVVASKAATETKSGLNGVKKVMDDLNPLDENSSAVERIVGGVAQSLPVMIVSSLVGGQLVSGAGLVSGASKGAQLSIQAVSQIPFFTSTFSSGYQQARQMGFVGEAASKYAFLTAAIETGTENLFLPTGIRKMLGLPMEASENAVKYTLKQYFKDMVKEGGTEALNEPLQALMQSGVFGIDQQPEEVAKATFESFIAGGLMSGLFSSGSLMSGMKYEVKGADEATGKFIVETEDGRTELVSPEVLTTFTAKQLDEQRLAAIEAEAQLAEMEEEQNPEQITEPPKVLTRHDLEPIAATKADELIMRYHTSPDVKQGGMFNPTKDYEAAYKVMSEPIENARSFDVVRNGVRIMSAANRGNYWTVEEYDSNGKQLGGHDVGTASDDPGIIPTMIDYKILPSEMVVTGMAYNYETKQPYPMPDKNPEPTIAPQEPTSPVQAFEPETEANIPQQSEAVVEPANEVAEVAQVSKPEQTSAETKKIEPEVKKVVAPKPTVEALRGRIAAMEKNGLQNNSPANKKKYEKMKSQLAEMEDTLIETADEFDEQLLTNSMEMAEEKVFTKTESVASKAVLSGVDMVSGFKVSTVYETGRNVSDLAKQVDVEPSEMMYKTTTNAKDELLAYEKVKKDYDKTLAELAAKRKSGAGFTSQDVKIAAELKAVADKQMNEYKDVAYWRGRFQEARILEKEALSNAGQTLQAGKKGERLSPMGTAIQIEGEIGDTWTPKQAEAAGKLTDIINDPTINLDGFDQKVKLPTEEANSFIKIIKERFPVVDKKWLAQWQTQLEQGVISRANIVDGMYTILGVPHFGSETRAKILDHLKAMEQLEEGSNEFNIHDNEVRTLIRQEKGIPLLTKLSAVHTFGMLASPKSGIKNELGNWLAFGIGQLTDTYAHKNDLAYAKKTGVITTRSRLNVKTYGTSYKKNTLEGVRDFKNHTDRRAVNSKYFENERGKVFVHSEGGYLGIINRAMNGESAAKDSFLEAVNHTFAKQENLAKLILDDSRHGGSRREAIMEAIKETEIEVAKLNEGKPKEQQFVFPAEELMAGIDIDVAYNTYNSRSNAGKVLASAVRELNRVTTAGRSTEFGLGSFIAKFVYTPVNMAQYGVEHLGGSYVMALSAYNKSYNEYKKLMPKEQAKIEALKDNQRNLAVGKARAMSGMSLMAVGAMLAGLGGITPDLGDDDPKKGSLEAQGYKNSYLNISALARFAINSQSQDVMTFDGAFGEVSVKDGDTLRSIDWVGPGSLFLKFGARMYHSMTAEDFERSFTEIAKSLGVDAVDAGLASIADANDLPFNRTLQIITKNFKYEEDSKVALGNIANEMAGNMLVSWIPAGVKQTAQFLDPYAKKYSKDTKESVKQQAMAALPTLRDNVPYAVNVDGSKIEYYSEKNLIDRFIGAYASPYFESKVTAKSDIQAAMKSIDTQVKDNAETVANGGKAKTINMPQFAPNKFDDNKITYNLSREQQEEWQKVYWESYKINKTHTTAYDAAKKAHIAKYVTGK